MLLLLVKCYIRYTLVKELAWKNNYEKTYEEVNLDFSREILLTWFLGIKMISWFYQITHGWSVGIKVNNDEEKFFTTSEDLRQGGHMSPILFNWVVDVLTRMLAKGSEVGSIGRICPSFYLEGNMQMIPCCF